MITMKKVAIVRYMRTVSTPRLAALVAQHEVVLESESGSTQQITPPGMHLIFLPYADDIRNAETTATTICRADESAVSKAADMLSKMALPDFTSSQIANPALQQHYAVLHALALGEAADPKYLQLQDGTDFWASDNFENDDMRAAFLASIMAFKDEVYGANYDEEEGSKKGPKSGAKRKAADPSGGTYTPDVEAMAHSGKLASLTVPQLKAYLNQKMLSSAGKKAELVERILGYVNK